MPYHIMPQEFVIVITKNVVTKLYKFDSQMV